ncbi:hypothetical protein [Flavobacterium lindanitolerans]|uniref:hypothetical protein n=1 Tax=Flavobacterium lindanitolerans TaxID=428988 RepID=UPI0012106E9F|nr:hypothetical protein [uncultured Flavobacterium sp.]THD32212.1 MAG: hypothetical protein DI588_08945 [Flavobacterium johnsoniae]
MKSYKLFIILFALLFSCESKKDKIKSDWKYYSGFDFGDFLSFKHQNLKIQNDTIYKDSTPLAIIVELKTNYLPGTENKLTLKDIKSGALGIYTDKGK